MKKLIVILLLLGGCYQDDLISMQAPEIKSSYDFQYSIVSEKQVQMEIEYSIPYTMEIKRETIITPWLSEKFQVDNNMFYCWIDLKCNDSDYEGYVYFLIDGTIEQDSYLYHRTDALVRIYIDLNHDETGTIIIGGIK